MEWYNYTCLVCLSECCYGDGDLVYGSVMHFIRRNLQHLQRVKLVQHLGIDDGGPHEACSVQLPLKDLTDRPYLLGPIHAGSSRGWEESQCGTSFMHTLCYFVHME